MNADLHKLFCELRALSWVHHTFHWVSSGDYAFQDHLLFERLYEGILKEVDTFAEKLVGTYGNDAVEPVECIVSVAQQVQAMVGVGEPDGLIPRVLDAEKRFIRNIEKVLESAEVSAGMENFLAGVADKHEEHCYLLQQHMRQVKLARAWGLTAAEEAES